MHVRATNSGLMLAIARFSWSDMVQIVEGFGANDEDELLIGV